MSRGGCSSRTTVALFVVGLLVQLGIQLDSVWFWFGLLCIHCVSVVFCRDRFLAFPVKFSAARHVAVRRRSRRRDFSLIAFNRPSPLPQIRGSLRLYVNAAQHRSPFYAYVDVINMPGFLQSEAGGASIAHVDPELLHLGFVA